MVPSDAVGVGAARPDAAAIARQRGCREKEGMGAILLRTQNVAHEWKNATTVNPPAMCRPIRILLRKAGV